MKHPFLAKAAALVAVTLLLLFGLGMIEDIVRDRQHYRSEATRSVAQSLAGPQTLLGPMLHSACVETWDTVTGKG
ncbi:inner membrane CreD family protein, partial [Paracidovorax avenae]